MKIVHICFSNSYNDGWGYQDNLLPEYLSRLGTQNYVIASINHFPDYMSTTEIRAIQSKGKEYVLDSVNIRRIKTTRLTSTALVPHGLCDELDEIKPDVIFHHNICLGSMYVVAKYARKNKIPLFIDNHADELNMRSNKWWTFFYHKFLLRKLCHSCDDVVSKYYGVTNSRCDFIYKYYMVPKDKIELLPIGADTDFADTIATKEILREKYQLSKDDFIVVSGGKMGIHKGTDNLIEAVSNLYKKNTNIRLILFGKFEDERTESMVKQLEFVTVWGWCDRLQTLELLKLADVACWPIHHTTLIEDAISVETSLIIRKTGTTKHLILNNGVWLGNGNSNDVKAAIEKVISLKDSFMQPCKMMKEKMSYRAIAEKIILDASNEITRLKSNP